MEIHRLESLDELVALRVIIAGTKPGVLHTGDANSSQGVVD